MKIRFRFNLRPRPRSIRSLASRALWPLLAGMAALSPLPGPVARGDPPPVPLSGSLAAKVVYVADSADNRIISFIDRDGSGSIELERPGEITVFYDDASPGPNLSTPSALLAGTGGELYVLDAGALDAVLVLKDLDGDGTALGAGEWRVFYDDSSPGPNLSNAQAMAFGPGGEILVADNGKGAERILSLVDRDGDGSANGPDEWRVLYDQTALSPPAGPLLALEAIAALPDGRVLVSESTLGKIFILVDADGDGTFLGSDEARVFYDPFGAHPFASLQALAIGPGGEVYAADSKAGLTVLLRDLDGDGEAVAPNEASLFLDPALGPKLKDAADLLVLPDGTLLLLDRDHDAVLLARDLDGDHLVRGTPETQSWLLDTAKTLSTPSAVAVAPLPPPSPVTIASLEPAEGPATGGTRVRLRGAFPSPEGAQVKFAGALAAIVSATEAEIECLTPAGPEGAADVEVVTAAGRARSAGGFRYQGAIFIRGEVNGDGEVDLSDAVSLLAFLFLGGPSLPCDDALDADDDGGVNITDAIFILGYLFEGGQGPPPPFPQAGPDLTPDPLGCSG